MTVNEIIEHDLPAHLSHSQMSTFFSCARKYYFSKKLKLPEKPAAYLVSGSAIHELLEKVNYHIVEHGTEGLQVERDS